MKRVIFVDDQPEILQGLRNVLRRQRKVWDMVFVEGGPQALDAMNRSPFDVIVTDMRMPGMDGAELLRRVQDKHPSTVRLVLSGHAGVEAALRAVPVAHQFLSKPCDAEVLENVVDRSCRLQELVEDEQLQCVIGKINRLPPVPRIYAAITELLVNPTADVQDLSELVEQDMSMTAKLLQMVNSAFFTSSMSVADVQTAVARVGFTTVKNLALMCEVFDAIGPKSIHGCSVEDMQSHGLLTARISRGLVSDRRDADDAFMAGLLHDIGKLVLASELPDRWTAAVGLAVAEQIPVHEAEAQLHGATHAEIGAYLLGLWGIPYPIVEAVANHHAPRRVASRSVDVLVAVHVANGLAHEQQRPREDPGADDTALIDLEYITELGLAPQLDVWRAEAAQRAASDRDT